MGPISRVKPFRNPEVCRFERIYACCPKNGTFLVFGTPTPRSMDDVERTAMTDHPIWPLIRRSCAAHAQGSGRMHRIAAKRHLFETGRVQLRRKRNCSSQGRVQLRRSETSSKQGPNYVGKKTCSKHGASS